MPVKHVDVVQALFSLQGPVVRLLITLLTSWLGWSFLGHILALAEFLLKHSFSQNYWANSEDQTSKIQQFPTGSSLLFEQLYHLPTSVLLSHFRA